MTENASLSATEAIVVAMAAILAFSATTTGRAVGEQVVEEPVAPEPAARTSTNPRTTID
ncbi:MAG: hypothetical protein GXX86_10645 [Propionibacterium sp.]|nr:hypothetical protein [Propionibacterium sp.]